MLSLGTIKRIGVSLCTPECSFVFPSDLDLARPASESGWDSDSETELWRRGRPECHKEVVNEVEEVLKEIGRRAEKRRERTRSVQEPLSKSSP